jgi:hypothetical protein
MEAASKIVAVAVYPLGLLLLLLLCRKYGPRVALIVGGAVLLLRGVTGLLTRELRQESDAAAPLRGSGALAASLIMIGFGSWALYMSLRRRQPPQRDRAEHAPPNGDPAKPQGNSEAAEGPPSVS